MSSLGFLNRKKSTIVFLCSIVSVGIFLVSVLFANLVCQKWYGLIVAAILMIAAIPIHIKSKQKSERYLISLLFNVIGAGFSTSVYYIKSGTPLNLYSGILSAIPAVAILVFAYIMIGVLKKSKKIVLTVLVLANIGLIVVSVIYWITESAQIFSFSFFALIISLISLCVSGVTVNHNERSVLRDISFGGFGILIIISVVVIFVLSEGEVLEGIDDLDFAIGSDDSADKKKTSGFENH